MLGPLGSERQGQAVPGGGEGSQTLAKWWGSSWWGQVEKNKWKFTFLY